LRQRPGHRAETSGDTLLVTGRGCGTWATGAGAGRSERAVR
jgi:hypothetical protein